jgi:uncharacterized repeat protein (TIGR03837 family)
LQFSAIDIFCHVVDNFGDIGVVYRFARAMKSVFPDKTIRVFVDDLITFKSICAAIDQHEIIQEHESIIWINLASLDTELLDRIGTAELVFETFACEIPSVYMKRAYYQSKLLINLEHLSAEEWVEGYHGKESLLPEGTLKKYYFMPGFTEKTGGIIPDMFDPVIIKNKEERLAKIKELIPSSLQTLSPLTEDTTFGSVFTYIRSLDRLLEDCLAFSKPTALLSFGEKATKSFRNALKKRTGTQFDPGVTTIRNCTIIQMPFLAQQEYDQLLRLMDFNIVRGEDSLTRAVLAGKPFIWNAYIQDNCYQVVKVEALCSTMKKWLGDSLEFDEYRKLMVAFNSASDESFELKTNESFLFFLKNLKKFEHSITEMSYFMTRNCNLIKNITNFISKYPYNNE